MKYTFKEKQKHFTELGNPLAASADLVLLQQRNPHSPDLKKYARNPLRYADDILYRLLDVAGRDEIRKFRREWLEDSKPAQNTDSGDNPSSDLLQKKEQTDPPKGESPDQDEVERLRQEKEQTEERAKEAEEALEETETALEDMGTSLEEEQQARIKAEERAEIAEAALEEEKKKADPEPVKKKSKSTRNTRTSTGTTSSTPTSS